MLSLSGSTRGLVSMPGSRLTEARRRLAALAKLAVDAGFLMLGRYGQLVVSLVTIPVCARALGLQGMGQLAVGMSAAFIGSLLVDFGLTQLLAGRGAPDSSVVVVRSEYLALRLALLSFLAASSAVVAGVGGFFSPAIAVGLLSGGLSSMGEEWMFIASGSFGRMAGVQVLGRLAYLVSVVIVVPILPSATTVLVITGVSNALIAAGTWWLTRAAGLRWPTSRGIRSLVVFGFPGLLARGMNVAYAQLPTLAFAAFFSPTLVGLYSAAEKLARVAQSVLDVVGVALMPRMARSRSEKYGQFLVRARKIGLWAPLVGVGGCLLLWAFGPILVVILFGPEFLPSIEYLHVMSVALPFTAASSLLLTSVIYVASARRSIVAISAAGCFAAAVSIPLVLVSSDAAAFAWVVVVTEATVALACVVWLIVNSRREREVSNG